jgi:predicted nucleic acid-binding protein
VILLDTSGLLSALFTDQRHHPACARVIEVDAGPFVLSPFVLAELDYLIGRHAGSAAQSALLRDVASGAYDLAAFDRSDIARAESILRQYQDLEVGLADASIAVLSERLQCLDLLSLDQRHFRVLRGHRGRAFRLLPSDSAGADL